MLDSVVLLIAKIISQVTIVSTPLAIQNAKMVI